MDTIGKIEKGEANVQVKSILNLAFSYSVSATELLPGLAVAPGREMRFDHEITERQRRRSSSQAKAQKAARD
jgi:hypothetical protein